MIEASEGIADALGRPARFIIAPGQTGAITVGLHRQRDTGALRAVDPHMVERVHRGRPIAGSAEAA